MKLLPFLALFIFNMSNLIAGPAFSKPKHTIASAKKLRSRAIKINGTEPLERIGFFELFDNKNLSDAEIKKMLDEALISLLVDNEARGAMVELIPPHNHQDSKDYSHIICD